MAIPFTRIPEIDYRTLLYLPDRDLGRACQTDKYVADLCEGDYLWKMRISDRLDDKYLEGKPENITWQDWYFFWADHSPDPIGEALNLSPDQAMIRLLTENNVVRGSEAYQNIGIVLIKAFETGDDELVNYFMQFYRQLAFKQYTIPQPLFTYTKVVTVALANGFIKEAGDILGFSFDEFQRVDARDNYFEDTFEYGEVIRMAGEHNLEDFYQGKVRDNLERIMDLEEADMYFIAGLARAGLDEEAFEKLDEYLAGEGRRTNGKLAIGYYQILIEGALEGGNIDFIDELESYIPAAGFPINIYRRSLAREALIQGYSDVALEFEGELDADDLFMALIPKYPDLAFTYLEENPGIRIYGQGKTCYQPLLEYASNNNKDIIPDVKTCSRETLLSYLQHPNPRRYIKILTEIVSSGRYDILEDVLNELRQNENIFNTVLENISTYYADIFLYLILKYIEEYATLPTVMTREESSSLVEQTLKQAFEDVDVDDIPNLDFLPILLSQYAE